MSVGAQKTGERKNPPIGAIIALVVLLVVFLAWYAEKSFNPMYGAVHAPQSGLQASDEAYIRQEAQASQGDFNKLSPADQQKVNQILHGWGAVGLKSWWTRIQQGSH